MILPDVNVLVGAFRADAPRHDALRAWLEEAVAGPETLGVTDAVLGGTVRVLTHPRVFARPTPLAEALTQVEALRSHPDVVRVAPGARHWDLVTRLCRDADARGNLVADAQHAAVAVEHGATWVSQDRDFARFPGLRWRPAVTDVT
ncbi:type II toxin-antitoxin system VapC family toxin [Cellulomonas shaoxiangyii]|uniref:Ribonuclease VapC n=1 Tax=Cellulomonas shaoxiangyii TaxID=2566013 RepID=A0A4P7SG95_9CELL|nr:type II toxin-antitoxin system VapC family toxin [Cellulomonas shaoxiangyii]QCB92628.1 PIN domain-containing protein [Cellulomonas shaoxiangyii]TGY85436.1 PIN domain-containing protein [Cellulomonas shaoxiangyii]